MLIEIPELKSLIIQALRKKYDQEDSELIADVIIFGELSGKVSHGLIRLFAGKSGILSLNPSGEPTIKRKTKLSALIEGNGNPGMLVGTLAMKEVIKIAKENAFGIVGARNSRSSSGCLSFYLEKIAQENLIGIIMAQSPASTAPFGGIEPLFGTNPISFGIPANPHPLIFDMGTSAISFGAILRAKELDQKLPANVATDKEGNMTTNPSEAVEGATLAFDNSYKGTGLAMIVEILSGLWPNADFAGENPEGGWGNTFMALSPDLLMNTEDFKKKTEALIKTIRNSKTKDDRKVRIPGERTIQARDDCLKRGLVEVEGKLLEQLKNYPL